MKGICSWLKASLYFPNVAIALSRLDSLVLIWETPHPGQRLFSQTIQSANSKDARC